MREYALAIAHDGLGCVRVLALAIHLRHATVQHPAPNMRASGQVDAVGRPAKVLVRLGTLHRAVVIAATPNPSPSGALRGGHKDFAVPHDGTGSATAADRGLPLDALAPRFQMSRLIGRHAGGAGTAKLRPVGTCAIDSQRSRSERNSRESASLHHHPNLATVRRSKCIVTCCSNREGFSPPRRSPWQAGVRLHRVRDMLVGDEFLFTD